MGGEKGKKQVWHLDRVHRFHEVKLTHKRIDVNFFLSLASGAKKSFSVKMTFFALSEM